MHLLPGLLLISSFCHLSTGDPTRLKGSCQKDSCGQGQCETVFENYHVCRCDPAHIGIHCEEPLCTPSCVNGGVCRAYGREFRCECPKGFSGVACEKRLPSICTWGSPCGPYGKCSLLEQWQMEETGRNYTCQCELSFFGDHCSESAKICDGDGIRCQNGGTCLWLPDPVEMICRCPEGFVGDQCETLISACSVDSCLNGGQCSDVGPAEYECTCPPGFTGRLCETNLAVTSCTPRSFELNWVTARHADAFKHLYSKREDKAVLGYCLNGGRCDETALTCICPLGYTGVFCENPVSQCSEEPCLNGGFCSAHYPGGPFYCSCQDAFMGRRCEIDKDDCIFNKCSNGSLCVDLPGGYKCECPTGSFCNMTDACSKKSCGNGSCFFNIEGIPECTCEYGWEGSDCSEDLDECSLGACQAGANCSNLPGTFHCHCPPGTAGEQCEFKLRPCQGEFVCENDGHCGEDGECVCPPGLLPPNCMEKSVCTNETCLHGGICHETPNKRLKFTCECPTDFTGRNCETELNPCWSRLCLNGGKCVYKNDRTDCQCEEGFTGYNCETNINDCLPGACRNGGTCHDLIHGFRCECSQEFTGEACDVHVKRFEEADKRNRSVCADFGCAFLAGDGHCDQICNSFGCDFDGGDCSARTQPFSRCDASSYCAHSFADGKCDPICNREECLFDGFDCLFDKRSGAWRERCPINIRHFCSENYANGICDEKCHREECGMDGGDCERTQEERGKDPSSDLMLILQVVPEVIFRQLPNILMLLAQHLRASLRVRTIDGVDDVFEWSSLYGVGRRISTDYFKDQFASNAMQQSRSVWSSGELRGVMVVLQVDFSECRVDCFTNASSVANFLGAATAKQSLSMLGLPIYEAKAALRSKPIYSRGSNLNLFLALICFLLATIAGITVASVQTSRKRVKILQSKVWGVPTEHQAKEMEAGQYIFHGKWFPPFGQPYNSTTFKGYPNQLPLTAMSYSSQPTLSVCTASTGTLFSDSDPNRRDQTRDTPLLQAVAMAGRLQTPIDQQLVNIPDELGLTPVIRLAFAVDSKSDENVLADLATLAAAGADLNAQDKDGNTALHYAIVKNRISLMRKLLLLGADPNIVNDENSSPLHCAAKHGWERAIDILLQLEEVLQFVDTVDDHDMNPLMLYAAYCDHSSTGAERLVQAGADLLFSGDKSTSNRYRGRTALHWAALKNNVLMTRWLLKRSANRDAQDIEDATPLWHAVSHGNFEAIEVLLEFGASLDFADHSDRTPLQIAYEKGDQKLIDLLENAARNRHSAPTQAASWNNGYLPVSAPGISQPIEQHREYNQDTSGGTVKKRPAKKAASSGKGKSLLTPPESSSSSVSACDSTPSPSNGIAVPNSSTNRSLAETAAENSNYHDAQLRQPQLHNVYPEFRPFTGSGSHAPPLFNMPQSGLQPPYFNYEYSLALERTRKSNVSLSGAWPADSAP